MTKNDVQSSIEGDVDIEEFWSEGKKNQDSTDGE